MSDVERKQVLAHGETHTVPREPSAYRATTHFQQRAKERLGDSKRSAIIRSCITHGECYGTTPPRSDDHEVKQYFAFHWQRWRVIVGIRSVALCDPDKKHYAVTVMEVHDDA